MKKRTDSQGSASTATLAALLYLFGGDPSAAKDTLSGGVSTEQDIDDSLSVNTDVTTGGNTGDCLVSAHASASSTSNGETVSKQSEKSVNGPCGKASAKASASSSSASSADILSNGN